MSAPTDSNPKPLFLGLLALFALLAVLAVVKLFEILTTVVIVVLVIIGVYEGVRIITLMRGLTPPPSSLGLIRGAGRLAWKGVRVVPACVRWGGRTAFVMAHSTHEIATGAVLGGLLGLAAGWHYSWFFTGTFLGVSAGVALGTYIGARRMKPSPPPVIPAAQSQSPGS